MQEPMSRPSGEDRRLACASCGAPGDEHTCKDCHRARLDRLLESFEWRVQARGRAGDEPGETLLTTIIRERHELGDD